MVMSTSSAFGATITITQLTTPPPTVLEGGSGIVDYKVTSVSIDPVTITSVSQFGRGFQKASGEDEEVEDAVTLATITFDFCTGSRLLLGGTCAFSQAFRTGDGRPDGDVDTSHWQLLPDVFFTVGGAPGNAIGFGDVFVTDPPVPEPSTLALGILASLGLTGRIAVLRRRSSPRPGSASVRTGLDMAI